MSHHLWNHPKVTKKGQKHNFPWLFSTNLNGNKTHFNVKNTTYKKLQKADIPEPCQLSLRVQKNPTSRVLTIFML